ncbi:lipid-A-disaccharide synthase [Azospira sp. I13]|uniref:lipid-A-disaccharide synthase n=1 Tax=Azospira sp. I13 TaxID=1765050 RepID=UPI000D4D5C26|nr:lipid-A-disaccharide synthase [Azospira sp. I13]GBG01801.1 lipid-A-disaccharide synthase [Azospira sp. I13]
MAGNGIRIAMVAGEASGDLLASHLIKALKQHLPDATFYGIGGPKMAAQGFDAWWPLEKLAVRGYVEVLKHYREITGIRRQLKKRLLEEKPDVFIGVDAPDFNLDLERALKNKGVPAIHYVSPSIWAWRGKRIHKIARSVSRMLCLFPFEPALYEAKGVPVDYVGHPVADMAPLEVDRKAAREKLNLPVDAPIFAFLPGSRQSELEYMADTFIETAKRLHARLPRAIFLVPLATRETRLLFETAMYRHQALDLPFNLLFGHSHDAMAAADTVLVASGTATLEAALLKRPMAIAYRMAPFSWRLMKRMKYQPWVGLPNILAGQFVVPEFLQEDATPDNLAQALLNLQTDKVLRQRIEEEFLRIHLLLRQNTAEKAAAAILSVLGRRPLVARDVPAAV